MTVANVLQKIIEQKQREVAKARSRGMLGETRSIAEEAGPTRGFRSGLRSAIGQGLPAVIAEIKKASPSKGVIRENFDPSAIAESYAAAGAACLSVLTDELFFQGGVKDLQQARQACDLPVLRKDFVIDTYQVYETRAMGADAILLIVAALDAAQCRELAQLATELALDVLVEVHDEYELETALTLDSKLVGVNNRDLHTFVTSLETSARLAARIPPACLGVAESGILSAGDVAYLLEHGMHAFLVGEALMKAVDPGQKLRELFGMGR